MTQNAKRPSPHGYVLLIVLTIGIAASLAAVALLTTAGGGKIAAIHSTDGDLSGAIAQAGMDRAIAYLQAVAGATRDFDEALDPGRDTTCTGAADGTDFTPTLTDGARVSVAYLGNKRFTRVPYNGGAYLIRFDDDDDDHQSRSEWSATTSNNNANWCDEGPGSPWNGKRNPYRDRNRAVHITVIGIYPGTDADSATHRTALYRFFSMTRPPSAAGLRVRGNIDLRGGVAFRACSPTGSIEIDGAATFTGTSATGCACGISSADSWDPKFEHCRDDTTMLSDCETTMGVGCQPGSLETPGPTIPALPGLRTGADHYIDWSRPCVFWVDPGTAAPQAGSVESLGTTGARSLWFWDAAADRGPGRAPCSSFEGQGLAFPGPPDPTVAGTSLLPATNPAAWRGCWTPIVYHDGTTYQTPWTAAGVNEFSVYPPYPEWTPTKDTATIGDASLLGNLPRGAVDYATGALSAVLPPAGFPALVPPLTLNKPDWSQCTIDYPPFPEPPATSQTHACTTCDGIFGVIDVGTGWWDLRSHGDVTAVPAGVYVFPDHINQNGGGSPPTFIDSFEPVDRARSLPALANSPTALSYFPLMTMYIAGNLDLQQNPYYFGSGQTHNGDVDEPAVRVPSLIVGGTTSLQGNGVTSMAGSIYALGGLSWKGGGQMHLLGELHSNTTFAIGGNGQFYWYYVNLLQELPPTVGYPPVGSRITQ